MSVRRDAMIEVGGLRQEFSRIQKNAAGAEETDLCIRLQQRWPDGLVLYDPVAAVEHLVPAERAQLRYFASRCFAEGRSKAALSQMVGRGAGLSAERSYVRRTLPLGVLRGVGGLFRGDPSGLSRAAMIVVGLSITALGYLSAPRTADGAAVPAAVEHDPQEQPSPEFAPVRMDEVELADELPTLPPGRTRSGDAFASSLCLVRLHGQPLGLIEVDLEEDGVAPAELRDQIVAELGDQIDSHLRADDLPVSAVAGRWDRRSRTPRCIVRRQEALASPRRSRSLSARDRPDSVRITLRSILACDYPDDRCWK